MKRCGIVHNSGSGSGEKLYLPLEQVRVTALIIDTCCRVTLNQIYRNPSEDSTGRAKYLFAVPASAAICSFKIRAADGRTMIGVAKEKEKAREEFEQSVAAGGMASLLDYVEDDMFTISIGSVPPQQMVKIELAYVTSLVNDDRVDEIRFHLPLHVGERYGAPPPGVADADSPSSHAKFKLVADVQTSGKIFNIASPSHGDEITETRYPTHLGRPSRRRSTIRFRSSELLDHDFVLLIQAEKLDAPRCFAEYAPAASDSDPPTVAMHLAIIPKNTFLIDRSGAWGDRIETAKRTLSVLLRMIPSQGAFFNIFTSKPYSQTFLNLATAHTSSISADYGGTEISRALVKTCNARQSSIPTAIFILTDGQSSDVAGVISGALPAAPLRVFALGIGNEVSTDMVESIARAGNGVSLFALSTESILGKCARLFRAGRTPFVKNVAVDWGIPDEDLVAMTPSVAFNPAISPKPIALRRLPGIQQAPARINDIHEGTRMNIFVILSLKKVSVPREVTLRGELGETGRTFQMTVPIRGVQLVNSEPQLPLIHTLAAWRLIQEHEMKRAVLPRPLVLASDEEVRRATIVRLGETYQLASRYTSFVAVDSGERTSEEASNNRDSLLFDEPSPSPPEPGIDPPEPEPEINPEPEAGPHNTIGSMFRTFFSSLFGPTAAPTRNRGLPGGWPGTPRNDIQSDDPAGADDTQSNAETYSTMSSLMGSSSTEWSDFSAPPSPDLRSTPIDQPSSPQLLPINLAPAADRLKFVPGPSRAPIPQRAPPPPPQEVIDIITLQQFDGSFPCDDALRGIVGAEAIEEGRGLQVDAKVWATVLSITYITKQMGGQSELLDDLLVKARLFVRASGVTDLDKLTRRANELIG
ncbi:vault protein inter-alpha-trypsin domain-containing protein [Infundibulicybe gibba]|nr:vault protein inter-alpha-trypsin domain-containing protein [Infundibulicybe gibba]